MEGFFGPQYLAEPPYIEAYVAESPPLPPLPRLTQNSVPDPSMRRVCVCRPFQRDLGKAGHGYLIPIGPSATPTTRFAIEVVPSFAPRTTDSPILVLMISPLSALRMGVGGGTLRLADWAARNHSQPSVVSASCSSSGWRHLNSRRVHAMYLDDHPPVAGGRKLWGFTKKIA